jgi:hypothetical protein
VIDLTHAVEWRPLDKAPPTDGLTDRVRPIAHGAGEGMVVDGMTSEERDRFGVAGIRVATLYMELPDEGDAAPLHGSQVRTRPIARPGDPWTFWRVAAEPQRRDAGDESDHLAIPLEYLPRPNPW